MPCTRGLDRFTNFQPTTASLHGTMDSITGELGWSDAGRNLGYQAHTRLCTITGPQYEQLHICKNPFDEVEARCESGMDDEKARLVFWSTTFSSRVVYGPDKLDTHESVHMSLVLLPRNPGNGL